MITIIGYTGNICVGSYMDATSTVSSSYYDDDELVITLTRGICDWLDACLIWLRDLLTIENLQAIRTRQKQIPNDHEYSPKVRPSHPP